MTGGISHEFRELDDAMDRLAEVGWVPADGTDISTGAGGRESREELILPGRLRDAIERINPQLPAEAVDSAIAQVMKPESQDALAENQRIHEILTKGIRTITFTGEDGAEHTPTIRLIDTQDVDGNDFLAVSRVIVASGDSMRAFDIVLYLNGLPVTFFELKKGGSGGETLRNARYQLDACRRELPLAFRCNAVCVVSDGTRALFGTAFTPFEHFAPWNVDDDGEPLPQPPQGDLLPAARMIHGLFSPDRFLEMLSGYVTFSRTESGLVKRIARPHQYYAVSRAVGKTLEAVRSHGRIGVIWHTQGSGKSMEMELYATRVMAHPSLGNPTIVVLTDRTDLDDQLFSVFQASETLPEQPVRAASRDDLRAMLETKRVGGIIFSTLQKFGKTRKEIIFGAEHPRLSDRRNIILIVDEAHRSHYDSLDGYARHLRDALPYASMIAFTGTPIAEDDRVTTNVFGPVIDTYDLSRAVDDHATVRIVYESRSHLLPPVLPPNSIAEIVDEWDDETYSEMSQSEREWLRQSIRKLGRLYGTDERLQILSRDIVDHWSARSEQMRKFIGGPGKGMIVCATRDTCARLYDQIIRLRPDWHSDDVHRGKIKVVYSSGPGDSPLIRKHVWPPPAARFIQQRAKDPDDPLELVIVQSMLLTGFDSPPLHTMYVDKPMRGAALMQALARVNRTFRNKQDGLLVGYAPLAEELTAALAEYSEQDQKDRPVGHNIDDAVAEVYDLLSVIGDELLSGCDWRGDRENGDGSGARAAVLKAVNYLRDPMSPGNHVSDREVRLAEQFRRQAAQLTRMYALCSSSGVLASVRADVAFFEEVRKWMIRWDSETHATRDEPVPEDVTHYLQSPGTGAGEDGAVENIYDAAGIGRVDLSQADATVVRRLQEQEHPHLTVEVVRYLTEREIRHASRHNIVRQEAFSERINDATRRYEDQNLTAAQIIAELVRLAQEVAADAQRGADFSPPLDDDEMAFYDAITRDQSVVDEMGTRGLSVLARNLVRDLRGEGSIDWALRDDVRAKIRSIIRRLLAQHGYPQEKQETAIRLVLRQMEAYPDEWAPDSGR